MSQSNEPSDGSVSTGENGDDSAVIDRRRYLTLLGATTTALAGCSSIPDPDGTPTATPGEENGYHAYTRSVLENKYPGVELFSTSPPNGQTRDRSSYLPFETPVDAAYIRSHYDSPKLQESEHTISVEGTIESPTQFSMEELRSGFSTTEVAHTMQCAGNGRRYFDPSVGGNQWSFGAVSTAVYRGTPVSELLERVGIDGDTDGYVAVMGADAPEGEPVYTRSIPIAKLHKDCVLAYERNGAVLTAEHGFPVRLVVPGWYGCNSVKWVVRMVVMDEMIHDDATAQVDDPERYTHWQQSSYRLLGAQETEPRQHESIDTYDTHAQMESDAIAHPYCYEMLVKSLIAKPGNGATIDRGDGPHTIRGVAWGGENELEGVALSTDGGDSFESATFVGDHRGPAAWRSFEYEWEPTVGEHTLVSRATDRAGRSQPATIGGPDDTEQSITDGQYPWNLKGYGANAYMPEAITVTVTDEQ